MTTIAVTFPCHGSVLPMSTLTLMANVGRLASDGNRVVSVFGQSSIVAKSRNECVEGAIKNSADWIFMMDCDISGPTDIVERLLSHNKPLVGATYRRRGAPFELMGRALNGEAKITGLAEMSHMPLGCFLFHRSVFDRLSRPYFRFGVNESSGEVVSEDYDFCTRIRAAGLSVWCDAELSEDLKHWASLPLGANLGDRP